MRLGKRKSKPIDCTKIRELKAFHQRFSRKAGTIKTKHKTLKPGFARRTRQCVSNRLSNQCDTTVPGYRDSKIEKILKFVEFI